MPTIFQSQDNLGRTVEARNEVGRGEVIGVGFVERVAEVGELNETAVLVLQKDVVGLDIGVDDSQLLDVKKGEEELATEGLDCDEAETRSGSKLAECVTEVQRHEGKHDTEMIAVHEGLVNGNAVFGVLRVFGFDLFQ